MTKVKKMESQEGEKKPITAFPGSQLPPDPLAKLKLLISDTPNQAYYPIFLETIGSVIWY
jgi:hypothetical protein